MRCPFCNWGESRVIDSRSADEGNSIRRRRECFNCTRRFTTYEAFEQTPLMVVKKDGRRVLFERGKILKGVLQACHKRPVPVSIVEDLVDKVEKAVRNSMEQEVSTIFIGETVMDYLQDIDQVAYVRFASVYRQFADVNNFMQELEQLMRQSKTSIKSEG